PKPNELSPANRRFFSGCQGRRSVGITKGVSAREICGLSSLKCSTGGISPCSSESTTLIKPATPAADSKWPILVLTEPKAQRSSGERPEIKTDFNDSNSIGSPNGVPVPCASI